MAGNDLISQSLRADSAVHADVRAVLTNWRRLTGGTEKLPANKRRTLVACSAGSDSTALALILASASDEVGIAHVVHDIRPPEQTRPDRDAAAQLALGLGLPFLEASVQVAGAEGNTEDNARRARYRELARIARENNCPFIATGHQADDAAETMLMRLIRGTGPRGMRGVAERRALKGGAVVIRPMLAVTRQSAERICKACGVTWRHDASNDDTARTRAAIRAGVMPELERISQGATMRMARAAQLNEQLYEVLGHEADRLRDRGQAAENGRVWQRKALRGAHPLVLGEMVRASAGESGLDKSSAQLEHLIEAIRDRSGELRLIRVGDSMWVVRASVVEVSRAQPEPVGPQV